MKKPAASMAKPAMKAKAKPAVKAMKAMSVIEHFARSDMADWAAMLLSSKLDAMYTRDVYPVTSQLCQTVCRATLLHIVMGLLGSIGALDTLPGVVSITCILYCVRMCFRMLISFLPQSCIDAQQSSRHPTLTELVYAPCPAPTCSRDLCGGGNEGSPCTIHVGSKAWLDAVLGVLKARHLHPPAAQIRMLVADEKVRQRLEGAKNQTQQVDILCGAAFKAKLGWQQQQTRETGAGAPLPKSSPTSSPDQAPPLPQWRLRVQDWQQHKLACTPVSFAKDARQDAFRPDPPYDPSMEAHSWRVLC